LIHRTNGCTWNFERKKRKEAKERKEDEKGGLK
jgi:hypothetical protein